MPGTDMITRAENTSMPVVVEFVGHAGSGKTFLKDHLLSELDGVCDLSTSAQVGVREAAAFVLFNPSLVMRILSLVAAAKPANARFACQAFKKMFLYQVKMAKGLRGSSRYVVCDEGMLHRLRMLRSGSKKGRVTYPQLAQGVRQNLFGLPDLVVFVVASLETTARRRVNRSEKEAEEEGVQRMIARKKESFPASLQTTEEDIRSAQKDHGFRYLKIVNEENTAVAPLLRTLRDAIGEVEAQKAGVAPLAVAGNQK